jgi:FkbM family methyltransferase
MTEKIAIVSYPKSGNTYLRFLVANYISNGNATFANIHEIIPDGNKSNLLKSSASGYPIFYKTHKPISDGIGKAIYVYRDPRDVSVSYYFYLKAKGSIPEDTDFEKFVIDYFLTGKTYFGNWKEHIDYWLSFKGDVLYISYEELLANPYRNLARVLKFSGIQIDKQRVVKACEKSSFEKMRADEKENRKASEEHQTILDEKFKFTRKGKVGDWFSYYSNKLLKLVDAEYLKQIEKLHYPIIKDFNDIHVFSNGIRVYRSHLIQKQIDRYKKINLHEPEEEEWFLKILTDFLSEKEKIVFIDIGSAIGYYTMLCARHKPSSQIHTVDLLTLHNARMKENLKLNYLNHTDIFINEMALSDSKGYCKFNSNLFGSKILEDPRNGLMAKILYKIRKKSVVRVNTFDGMFEALEVDIVKIDVQGAELGVLKGANNCLAKGKVKYWLIGTHGKNIHQECIAILLSNGYSILFENFDTVEQPDGIILAQLLE